MKNKEQSWTDREIWRTQNKLRRLIEKKAQESALDWDGKPLRAGTFPRPYMKNDPKISQRLGIDPEKPELNPACRCLNFLWDRIDFKLNLVLFQRVKQHLWGEIQQVRRGRNGELVKTVRYYALTTARAHDISLACGISKSLAQKWLSALCTCKVIKKVGRTKGNAIIYAVGFWVNWWEPLRRRPVPFPATTERKRLLRGISLQP